MEENKSRDGKGERKLINRKKNGEITIGREGRGN